MKLFGVDFASEIAKGIGPGLLPAKLIKINAGAVNTSALTAGPATSKRSYSCRGIVEDYKDGQFDGTSILRGDKKILILGGTLAKNIVPEPGDEIHIENVTRKVVEVSRDPAGATYSCQARG